ncbi:MAG: phenylalanine--tRNA ligase beta subunit-related protein [Eubacteriales bacterium]|nr:phenylalanine--tRNA ligase beta subunit-related protein [Eubacteriales bacterium]
MHTITIDNHLKQLWPDAVLGCVQCKVTVQESPGELLQEIEACSKSLRETIEKVPDLPKRDKIAQTRSAYKAFGKEPSRYRNSAEAMCRRILQGKGLYQINNVVECNNLFSIKSGYSLGAYDVNKIDGDVVWKVAEEGAHYQGIGKDQINVEFLPVFSDSQGPFGNPTSDSVRTRITEEAREILMVIFGFSGTDHMEEDLKELCSLLEKYCNGREFETAIIV